MPNDIQNQSTEISLAIESVLFVSPEPVSVSQLAATLDISAALVELGLDELERILLNRGIRLQRSAGRVQLTTAPEAALVIEKFLGLEATARLSHAALETLAIVCYQQPVTRPYLDGIRGVNCDGVVKSLLGKALIQEVGRADGPGRPILYGTTPEFLQYFGIGSIRDLPPLNLPSTEKDNNHDDMLKG